MPSPLIAATARCKWDGLLISNLAAGLAVGIFLLTCHDSAFSERRIKKYGLDVETSWLITTLAPFTGLQLALAFGLVIPSLVIVAILAVNGWTTWMAMWFGAKLLNLRYQYFSMALEAEVDRLRSIPTEASSLPRDDGPSGPVSS